MRTLSGGMGAVLTASVRQPRWKIVLIDALGLGGSTVDVSACVRDGATLEAPGDKRADRLTLTLMSYTDRFHPDRGVDRAYLAVGQVVRVYEGDASVPEADWVPTFYGHIRGQTGFTVDRQGLVYEAQVTAYGRRATPRFLKQAFTSQVYGRGVEYAQVCLDIAQEQMGLAPEEIGAFPGAFGKVTQFEANSIVDMTPLEAIDKILETVGLVADFNGAGQLRAYSRDVRRAPDLGYPSQDLILAETIAPQEIEVYTSVAVIGLDKNLVEVEEPEQVLARATIPVGFWRPEHTVEVRWTPDNTLRAKDSQMRVLTSILEHDLWGFSLGEESYTALGDYHGEIHVSIFADVLALLLLITLSIWVKAGIGDVSSTPGSLTTSFGKLLEALIHIQINMLMGTSSSGQYEIMGIPLIPIFKEVTGIATQSGVPDWALHQKEIRNDWCNTVEECVEVAKLELYWEVAQAHPRTVTVLDDARIEVGDLVSLPDGRKLWVESWRKTLSRGQVPWLEVNGYQCPAGV